MKGVACVAVIGKGYKPLFLKSYGNEEEIKFHFIVHSSLDLVEERANTKKGGSVTFNADSYLGLLCPIEDYKVYGYLTNTRTTFILVVDDADVKDTDARTFFRKFHHLYVSTINDPFYTVDQKLTSPRFEKDLQSILASIP
eukprot:TRINITY_DN7396_c0_g3_i1.p1 TRINITY_DN7396_c0_g3~~TRINITY_DN7396_c0_g3_i1.p1  ORF type:complete len:141 (-),score=34.84 TRINITY_DN7396_c0_g3_i1:113-535(-)